MKRVVFTLLIALALLHNVKAQGLGTFSNDFSMSHVVNVGMGVFNSAIAEDIKVNNQPMLSTSLLFELNPNLFAGCGVAFSIWNYSEEGDAKLNGEYYSVPVFVTARYFFGERRKTGLFFDAKIGCRLGNTITIDMLTEARTGQDDRIINGIGLYSNIAIGLSYRRFELLMGMDIQGVSYDVIDHSVVTATRYHRDLEESITTTMQTFVIQLGYWF